ncbi:hypothetical protein [Actinomadura sp. DC4]|uniref:hypothetical protein n=1 Tax=Actinomadura sp. DC4 TaxID=3055069 RepID=UPI0025B156A8|nr:hypothetical protein [Actinomadura sp. DC4]MDN3355275.1 hypothetical protein [Actinomadura sp. DC4]
MAMRRDRWRVGATSATLSAGALVFFVAAAGPASAETRSAATGLDECKLGKLLCGLLGAGTGTPAAPPSATAKPSSAPKPKPKPAAKPAPAHHGSSGGGSAGAPLPGGDVPDIAVPDSTVTPALPGAADQDPLVLPEAAPQGQAPAARLVAETAPAGDTVPPMLVATASGLIGALAALNLSVLRRRRND